MKKKECPSCAMEVDADAKVCPICGYEFTEGHSAGSRWLAILLIVAILLGVGSFLMSGGGRSSNEAAPSAGLAKFASTEQSAPAAAPSIVERKLIKNGSI